VFLHKNGIVVEDPEEVLYDVMIGLATKALGKPQLASTLRSLITPAA